MRRDSWLRDSVFIKARVRMARRHFIENGGAPFRNLVDVVLFPVQRGVGLDDYALARELLELFDEHGLARLQGFGDFRMDAQGQAGSLQVSGHLARFGLYFVTDRRYGLHHTRTRAVGTGLSKHPLERLLGALSSDVHQSEFIEGQSLGGSAVGTKRGLESRHHFFAVAPLFHINEVEHDNPSQIAQPDLPDDLLHGLQIGFDDGVVVPGSPAAALLFYVYAQGHKRLSAADVEISASFLTHPSP